mmetsp:Transcript_13891/g.19455  ORF Transcript_13891/g.19455 Transcript_13891/m.19455 type:complete len:229 (+) Transcript_13891:167-853(+)
MGKKSSSSEPEVVDASEVDNNNYDDDDDDDDEDHVEEMELLQVDVGDTVKVKQVLDETVAAAVLERIEEDYRLDNFKLGIMTTACVFAVVAQFGPVPFPESRPVLGVCCCAYFLLSGLLQLIVTFVDQDCILITKPKQGTSNKMLASKGIRVSSTLPRFSEWYTITLEFQGYESKENDPSPKVEQKWSVGQFFDVEGMFDEIGLMQATDEVYDKFEKTKYTQESKKQK